MSEVVNPALLIMKRASELANSTDPKDILAANANGDLVRTDYGLLKKSIISGTKKAVPSTTPLPWSPGDADLFEKYDVSTSGTYTNFKDSNGDPIIIDSTDLVKKIAQIWVTNGVSEKHIIDLPGVTVAAEFDPTNNVDAQAGKQINDYLTANIKTNDEIIDLGPFIQGFYSDYTDNAQLKPFTAYQALAQIDATGVYRVSLSGLTKNHGLLTFYGKKVSDGTYESIYEPANNTTLNNKLVDVEAGKYKWLYINLQSSVAANAKIYKRTQNKIFIPGSKDDDFSRLKAAAKYFIQNEIKTTFVASGFKSLNGNITPYFDSDYMEINASGVTALKITASTRNYDQGIEVVIGQKISDGSYVSLYNVPNYMLNAYQINIEPAVYSKLWVNVRKRAETSFVEVVRTPDNSIKAYIDNNAGGGGGINIPNTLIFAETAGVSANNSASSNLSIINQLIEANKDKGATIVLPVGNILINGTIQLWNSVSLIGALRGRVLPAGGTVLKATTSAVMINVKKYGDNDTAQPIRDMQLDGGNIAEKGIYVGPGNAFFKYENISIWNFTDVAFESLGALLYELEHLRIGGSPNGLRIGRTAEYQCNDIRMKLVQCDHISNIGTSISGGAQIVFEQCDWEHCGTPGNTNTGLVVLTDMSPSNEGIDATFNNCWSEHVKGGFWLKLDSTCRGITTFNESLLFKVSGDAPKGIINNGSEVVLRSVKALDFANCVETTNNGVTHVEGRSKIGPHTEASGGRYDVVKPDHKVFLTQSQYDALSSAEKNNGKEYYIQS